MNVLCCCDLQLQQLGVVGLWRVLQINTLRMLPDVAAHASLHIVSNVVLSNFIQRWSSILFDRNCDCASLDLAILSLLAKLRKK